MNIQQRFNLIFLATFFLGAVAIASISFIFERQQIQAEVMSQARLMLESALAIRSYTVQQVRPAISAQSSDQFFPQTVPSFAAHETFSILHQKYPLYSYREAVLNPTNPRSRATAWEVEIIQRFSADPNIGELTGHHRTEQSDALYLAHPIQITDESCLSCHSTADAAPKAMIQLYGSSNGFGWKMGEVVGAQIVSVPMNFAEEKAQRSLGILVISLFSMSILIYLFFNWLLRRFVLRPLAQLTTAADAISLGQKPTAEVVATGSGEIGEIAAAIKRLQQSFERAMELLTENEGGTKAGPHTDAARTEKDRL